MSLRISHVGTIGKAILPVIIGICLLGAGCGPPTVWKEDAHSPDGLWLASAETVQNGGPGNAAVNTMVYLKRTKSLRNRLEVLDFSCEGPVPRPYVLDNIANKGGTIGLTMKWINASHLAVTYHGHTSLDFQVVKYDGITISAEDDLSR